MDINLTQCLHRAVQQRPNRYATVFGSRRRTFREHIDRVARLAAGFQKLGLRAGDRLGILALNSDRYQEYYFAVPWAGLAANPCNTRWSIQEIAYSLKDCDTTALLIDDSFFAMVPALREAGVKTFVHVGDGPAPDGMLSFETLIAEGEPIADAMCSGEALFGIFYTGGTTGVPKGVMLTHSNVFASALGLSAELAGDDAVPVYLHAAPMFHMADTAGGLTYALRGATHAFVPSFTPDAFLSCIENEKVTSTLLVPTMVQLAVDSPAAGRYRTDSLTRVLYGASAISEAVLRRALAAWPTAKFIQAYGMTELSPVATTLGSEYHVFEGPNAGRLRAAGRASQGTDVRIFDFQDKEVPRGTVGEIVCRGPNVMKGYWNKPELTAEALRGGYMHTGDGGVMDDDGFVFVVDRLKDMIVSGGENVYSGEVENALMQHSAVAMCAVIPVPDPKWGERVHAVIVLRAGKELTDMEAIAHCKTLIASYKAPRSVEFRPELPISGAGKILKAALREPYWKGVERRVGGV